MSIEKTAARDTVRVLNKHIVNPAVLRLAGRKHFYASAIQHTGRRSGNHYVTPVAANRVVDGFIVPLPYGAHTDWMRNLVAEQHGTLHFRGETFDVNSPVVIDAATASAELPSRRRRVMKRLGIREFVHLNATEASNDPRTPASPE
jgi:deazaflavin-dependent oxidoreductase (nitroreductase family)